MSSCTNDNITIDGTFAGTAAEIKAIITLGAGNTITDMINSPDTQIPDGIKLYSGNDLAYIPQALGGTARDLVIYASAGLILSGLSVRYLDTVTDTWVGPIAPSLFITNGSMNWGCWKNFADAAVPFKSIITLLGAFITIPEDDDDVDDALNPDSNNAVSNKAVSEALQEHADELDEVAGVVSTVVSELQSKGVGYTVLELNDAGEPIE